MTRGVWIGGYWYPIRRSDTVPAHVGPVDCDKCFACGCWPQAGETVHFTIYGDLFCDPCTSFGPVKCPECGEIPGSSTECQWCGTTAGEANRLTSWR